MKIYKLLLVSGMLLWSQACLWAAVSPCSGCNFKRGDVDNNGSVNNTDVINIYNYVNGLSATIPRLIAADVDDDGDVDETDGDYLAAYLFSGGPQPPAPFASVGADPNCPVFLRGDANGNGQVTSADATFINNYLFSGGAAPCVLASADANGDGSVNGSDATFINNFVAGGSQPKAPFPAPGIGCNCP
jgi:hypothetical protein